MRMRRVSSVHNRRITKEVWDLHLLLSVEESQRKSMMEEVSAVLADGYQEPDAVMCGPAFQPSARKFVGCCINMFPTSPDFAASWPQAR